MRKKLTIRVHEDVCRGLHRAFGRRGIGSFIDNLGRPHAAAHGIRDAYRQMALDEDRERDALEWAEAAVTGLLLARTGQSSS